MTITKSVDQTIDVTSGRPPTMIEIFRRVLEVDDVTDTSDFFEAGGDSLLATRVLSAIAHEYDVELTFDDFVIAPSPDALAHLVEGLRP
jgi:acyl carrier protein